MENKMVNKDVNFSPKGVPIHSQVMKIKQESSEKIIIDLAPGQPEMRPVLREISRQISRSPLGISRRPISNHSLILKSPKEFSSNFGNTIHWELETP
ncbi:hypothetical protein PIB30_070091 [Stylosanthes scabra]|uniref:Uncharacterized protein n=1 Tax=Stylosanthes scabra TaxID=79078 RepID=A0ABU6RNW4_9FABA|nr:hypothetical protein [Stylosanthes scabra]